MTLYIKNMVCRRCILTVGQVLDKNGIVPSDINLGEAVFSGELSGEQAAKLRADLESFGFELLDDPRRNLVEKVKTLLLREVQTGFLPEDFSIVKFVGQSIHRDYSAISKLFSELEGISVEKYFILQKTEKVKELLAYNELTLSEIAYRLGYSSAAYLSSQFKRVTGQTPGEFKTNHAGRRHPLDELSHQ